MCIYTHTCMFMCIHIYSESHHTCAQPHAYIDVFVCSHVHTFTVIHQHTAMYCNTLQHTATNCSTLHHTAPYCNIF